MNFKLIIIFIILIKSYQLTNNKITIQKPYEKHYDIELEEEEVNIDLGEYANKTCPLPVTGCICYDNKIKCIYSNTLNVIPTFILSPLESSLLNEEEDDDDEQKQIGYNIDLKCKNITEINDLAGLVQLKQIEQLDMSGFETSSDYYTHCKWTGKELILNLTQFGSSIYDVPNLKYYNDNSSIIKLNNLTIHNLLLNRNQLKKVYLNRFNLKYYAGGSRLNLKKNMLYSFRIRNLDLSFNKIDDLNDMKYNLDSCYLEMSRLDVSNNKLTLIDVSFMVYLKYLNVSHNYLKSFSIYVFNENLPVDCNYVQWISVIDKG